MNKIAFCVFVFITALAYAGNVSAQDCTFYFPVKEGTELEMKNYNGGNKLVSTVYQKVLRKKGSGREMSVDVEVRSINPGGTEDFKKTLTVRCKKGIFVMDMSNFLPENAKMEGMENMEMKVTGSDMLIPGELKAGQKLPDAEMKVTMQNNGMSMMNLTTTVSNRKVDKFERVTTTAGAFDCYKISMDITTKGVVDMKMKMVQWIAKDIGIVKNDIFDEQGKKLGYSILTAIQN